MRDSDYNIKMLFSLTHEPIIGVRDSVIVFANPAAVTALKSDLEGLPATTFIPSYIFDTEMDCFIASAKIDDRSISISVSHLDGLTLLSLDMENEIHSHFLRVPPSFTSSLRIAVFNLKMAADKVIANSDNNDPAIRKYSSILYHNYHSMLRLLGNLSTADNLQTGMQAFNPQSTDMVSLCFDLIKSVQLLTFADRGISLKFECSEKYIHAVVDKELIERLLLQLLANSFMFTQTGGEIIIELKESCGKITLAVEDNGMGISPEVMSGIFASYEGTPSLSEITKDTGMGLNIAKGIAELHGGALIIESREKIGTHVRVMIPADNSAPTKFCDSSVNYNTDGLSTILTELSDVLSYECYSQKYLD